jgi:hypothetical protein
MSFGEDSAGELYLCAQSGDVYRLAWAGDDAGGKR